MAYSLTSINFISAFFILILGFVFGNVVSNIVKKILKGLEINKRLKEQLNVKLALEALVSSVIKYVIFAIALITALTRIGLSTRIFYIILGIILLSTILFTLLAMKDWVPNLISGFYLLKTKKLKRGATLQVKGVQGKVVQVNLLETKIRTEKDELIFIPNSLITKEVKA